MTYRRQRLMNQVTKEVPYKAKLDAVLDKTTTKIFGWGIEDDLYQFEADKLKIHRLNMPRTNILAAGKMRQSQKYLKFFRKSLLNRDNPENIKTRLDETN